MTDVAHVLLDVDLRLQPVTGRLTVSPHPPLSFEGYVQLIGILEALRSGDVGNHPRTSTPTRQESRDAPANTCPI